MPVAATALVWAKPQEGLGGKAPDPRRGHTLTLLPKEYRCTVLLFGGKDAVSGRHCNDLWQLDVGDLTPPRRGTWQWTQLTVKPTIDGLPSRRGGHSATVFRNYFVIFGGLGPEGLLNDVAALDLDNMEWKAPSTSGQPPIRRHQHSSCTFARQLVVFGGFSEYGDCENDIAVLDMDSWNWFVPKLTGEPPSPRMAHSATRFGKDMLVYGGYCVPETDGEKCYLSDVFVLKTDTWTWSTPEMSSAVPSSLERAGHLAEAINDVLLIVGGRGETPQDLCDIWTLDTTNWVWAKPTPVPEIPIAVCPAVSEHGMFLFGAPYSNACPTGTVLLLERCPCAQNVRARARVRARVRVRVRARARVWVRVRVWVRAGAGVRAGASARVRVRVRVRARVRGRGRVCKTRRRSDAFSNFYTAHP